MKPRLLDYLNPLWDYLGCRRFICGLRKHPYKRTYQVWASIHQDPIVTCNGCGEYLGNKYPPRD